LRGMQYLGEYADRSEGCAICPTTFSRNRVARDVAARVASTCGVGEKVIRADAKLAAAVRSIVDSCGDSALATMLAYGSRLSLKEIGMISRMAPPRQRYEMGQAAQGKRIGIKPKTGVPPLDTVRYAEVASRMQRFQGKFAKNIAALPVDAMPPSQMTDKLWVEIKRMTTNARALRQMIKLPRISASLKRTSEARRRSCARSRAHGDFEGLYASIRQLNGVLEKCLRDIPRMPKDVLPTAKDKVIIGAKLHAILEDARTLFSNLRGKAAP
jgi:hypothetical protein